MKKALALLMALVCLLTVTVIPVSAEEKEVDPESAFKSNLSFLDCYYTLGPEYMATTLCGKLYDWELGDATDCAFQPMAAAEFEKHLNLYFVANEENIAALRAYTIWDYKAQCDKPFYDAETDTYRVFFTGGFGGSMPPREYMGYVSTEDGYKVYYQHITYEYLEGEEAMAEAEKQDWPEVFIYNGHSYKNGPDGYTRLVSRDTYGNVYEVQYNNGIVRVLSQKAYTAKDLPTSLSPVVITKQPATAYAQTGKKATVSVGATGLGLSYTWYTKNAGTSKYTKSSVTKGTYSVTMSDKVDGRRIYCVVSDAYGNSQQTKTVTLRESVSIVTQPKSVTVANKKTAKVTVKAAGNNLKYTWYTKNAGASKYTKSSVTKSTYSVTMSTQVNGRRVYCVVKDAYGNTVQTKTVILRMSASIVTQPKSVTVANKKTAKITVKAVGDNLKYTWYIKNVDAKKFTKTSVTKSTYSVKMSSKVNGRRVYCVVKDTYGNTVRSKTVKLTKK